MTWITSIKLKFKERLGGLSNTSFNIRTELIVCFLILLMTMNTKLLALNPNLNWMTLETKHFLIHYPKYASVSVKQMKKFSNIPLNKIANLTEFYYLQLREKFNWQLNRKINIVIDDFNDSSNGLATVIPYSWVTLYLSPPIEGELLDHEDWLTTLIHHELVHIFHLDKGLSSVKNLRKFLGRNPLLFPNIFSPRWWTEGIATYYETDKERGVGRGINDYFKMIIREEVLHDFKAINQVSLPAVHWPLNQSYSYGVYFIDYLIETYGESSAQRWINNYSDNLIPYLFVSETEDVFDKSIETLWDDFKVSMKTKFPVLNDNTTDTHNDKVTSVPQQNASFDDHWIEDSRIDSLSSKSVYQDRWPIYSQAGDVLYIKNTGYQSSEVVKMKHRNPANKVSEQVLFKDVGIHQIEEAIDGSIWFRKQEICKEYNIYYDLYQYKNGSVERKTHCARIRHFAWLDDSMMVRLRFAGGIPSLDIYHTKTKHSQLIWHGHQGDVVGTFDVNPRTHKLVAMFKDGQSVNWQLATLDLKKALLQSNKNINDKFLLNWNTITNGSHLKLTPKWLNDHSIVFTQSEQGYFKPYQLELNYENGQLIRSTLTPLKSIPSGLFNVQVSKDQSYLLGRRYTHKGFDIVELPYERIQREKTSFAVITKYNKREESIDVAEKKSLAFSDNLDAKSHSYNPWKSLSPTYWTLFGTDQETGISVSGQDALNNHNYFLGVASEFKADDIHIESQYEYDERFGLHLAIDRIFPDKDKGIQYEDEFDAMFYIRWPFTRLSSAWDLRLVSLWNETKTRSFNTSEFKIQDNLMGFGVRWSSAKAFLYSAEKVEGGVFQYKVENRDVLDNNEHKGFRQQINLSLFFQPTERQGIALTGYYAHADAEAPRYSLGGTLSESFSELNPFGFGRDHYRLRGYPDQELSGVDLAYGQFKWQFPNIWINRTFMRVPIGLTKIASGVFYEYGAIGDLNQSDEFVGRDSLGLEWTLYTSLGYFFALPVTVYTAWGLQREGENETGLSFSLSF